MARLPCTCRSHLHLILILSVATWSARSEDGIDESGTALAGHRSWGPESGQDDWINDPDEVSYQVAPPRQSTKSQLNHHIIIPYQDYWQMPQVAPGSQQPANPNSFARRRKKDCGFPVMTRRLFGPVIKRSAPYLANSEEEIHEKIREEDKDLESSDSHARLTRSTETHSGGCLAMRRWIDMGSDYYPRYIKSYECTAAPCEGGFGKFGSCKPKHYTTKVLKRISTADSTSVEDCDHMLPEDLRVAWKLASVSVTTCCDCVGPMHG